MSRIVFFTDQTTNETSSPFSISDGGMKQVKVTGVFDGAVLTPEADFDVDDFASLVDSTFCDEGIRMIYTIPGQRIRFTLSDVGASTSITVIMK